VPISGRNVLPEQQNRETIEAMKPKIIKIKDIASYSFSLAVGLGLLLPVPRALATAQVGSRVMMAGPSPDSPAIVREITERGGNVVDATVAAVLAMSVTHPYYAALGGGGFALIKFGKDVRALDFRETAPLAANESTFKDRPSKASIDGGLAVAVPGVAAGLAELQKTYGKLKWSDVIKPAIRLAEKGFRVSGEWVNHTNSNRDRFNSAGWRVFSKNRSSLKPGDVLVQPALAKALKILAKNGAKSFYRGDIANDVIKTVNASGGQLTTKDFENYRPRWLQPLTVAYQGYDLYLMPPPSSGGVIIAQALRLMTAIEIEKTAPLSVDEFHALGEVCKLSYRGRSLLGDPDFTHNPVEQLTSKTYVESLAKQFKMARALDVDSLKEIQFEKPETTHISVMTANADAVALTLTLNGDYGSGLVSEKFGIALNNEMDDFTTQIGKPNMFGLVQGDANKVRAGARPLSSMTPTIITRNGATVMAIGAPGGPRIISSVLQVLFRSLVRKLDIDLAIQSPRVHHQFAPNKLFIDENRLTPETIAGLQQRGHKVEPSWVAKVYAVRRADNGDLEGAFDSRGEGAAGGE
jgi:gamma-glutamyltranspeptidase/glutathione hydrolase